MKLFKDEQGITFIELLVVLVCVTLLFSVFLILQMP